MVGKIENRVSARLLDYLSECRHVALPNGNSEFDSERQLRERNSGNVARRGRG